MSLDIPKLIRESWNPDRHRRIVSRSEQVGVVVAELKRAGWPAKSDRERRRLACRLLFARWAYRQGRLHDGGKE